MHLSTAFKNQRCIQIYKLKGGIFCYLQGVLHAFINCIDD